MIGAIFIGGYMYLNANPEIWTTMQATIKSEPWQFGFFAFATIVVGLYIMIRYRRAKRNA